MNPNVDKANVSDLYMYIYFLYGDKNRLVINLQEANNSTPLGNIVGYIINVLGILLGISLTYHSIYLLVATVINLPLNWSYTTAIISPSSVLFISPC